jgi:23S rRNA pseudoU1915 N3-methylase RlmH
MHGAGDNGTPLAFCIGGPFGHSAAMRARADDSVRLSKMVLNHQVGVLRCHALWSYVMCDMHYVHSFIDD